MPDDWRPTAIPRGTSHGDAAACRAGLDVVASARLFCTARSFKDGASNHRLERIASDTLTIRKYYSGRFVGSAVPSDGAGRDRARGVAESQSEGTGSVEAVELHGAAGHDFALRLRRKPFNPFLHHLWSAREEAVAVGIVGRPQDLVRADILRQRAERAFDRLEGDPAVALEQLARPGL